MKATTSPVSRTLSLILTASMLLGMMLTTTGASAAAAEQGEDTQPSAAYELAVTDEEREVIHDIVDELSGWNGHDFVVGDGTYDPNTLLGAMLEGSSYDSISYGNSRRTIGYEIPTEYPFRVPNVEGGLYDETPGNRNEGDRKAAKFAWVVELAESLGFDVVVQRQDDKYVYVEIGDPNAPEMIMGLSHLDSPSMSVNQGKLPIWVNSEGEQDENAYHSPYVKDGWIYGAGMQDDSGPTLATLVALKALLESGLPMDRRIRIVMGAYEDENPGVPSAESTLAYADIPYYTAPSFYDNWSYKALNREETPIAAYTSDSRFPVVVANTGSTTPYVTMDLSKDDGAPYSLISAEAGITLREDDPTLKDIITGSTQQIASRAIFILNAKGVSEADRAAFAAGIGAAAVAEGWLPANEGETPKVQIEVKDDTFILEINTGRAMEMPTPQYSWNAVVWGMYLLSENLPDSLQLKRAADAFTEMFYGETKEGEAYLGKNLGIPADILREPHTGAPNLTIAPMCFSYQNEEGTLTLTSFYVEGSLKIPFYVRYLYTSAEDFSTGIGALTSALQQAGFSLYSNTRLEAEYTAPDWRESRLYLSYDNPLTALQYASYIASIEHDPSEFADIYDLLAITTPMATTGGILAQDYPNKMTSFGAVIPGNERWWHASNERMKVDAAIEMTKIMADGMLEMARYSGPAGAQFMWADIDGLNADRADLDLLDVTIGTYQDASSKVGAEQVGASNILLGATEFSIDMWKQRNYRFSNTEYELGHEEGGVYLELTNEDFLANTFVLPMRLEFKVEKSAGMSDEQWTAMTQGSFSDCTFKILREDGQVITLAVPAGQDANDYFSVRYSDYNKDAVYVSVNLAIVDGEYNGVEAILADSKTDLFKLNDEWLAENENPFPERGQIEQRGFFLVGDGAKDACFQSPGVIYVTLWENPFEDVTTGDYFRSAVHWAVENNITSGTSATTFSPNSSCTRAEMITFLWKAAGSPAPASAANPFTDIGPDDYYYNAVLWAAEKRITSGTSETTFSPNETVTRGQTVTILYMYVGTPAVTGENPFTDVAADAYYVNAVRWAAAEGITSGTGAAAFSPEDDCTRAQIVTFLQKAVK